MSSSNRFSPLKPDHAESHFQLGNALQSQGKLDKAIEHYNKAILSRPNYFQAHNNLGVALQAQGKFDLAVAHYQKALFYKPDHASAHNNLGNTLSAQGRLDAAIEHFNKALTFKPDYAEAYNNLGTVLQAQHRLDEAAQLYRKALSIKPDYVEAHFNLGNVLQELDRLDAAVEHYRKALSLNPYHAKAHNNLGSALRLQGKLNAAVDSHQQAVLLNPDFFEAHSNLGSAFREQGDLDAAVASCRKAATLKPDNAEARLNLFYTQLHCCDWTEYARHVEDSLNAVSAGKPGYPFSFLAISASASAQLQCSRTYVSDKFPPSSTPLWTGQIYAHDKIRVAYLSADFHNHATAYLVAELFETHDKNRFELTALSFGPEGAESAIRERLQRPFDRFLDVRGKSDREVAVLLRELEMDIAIDLKGYTKDHRTAIFAHRPAPIQVNYLGYPGTMGASYIDYILADAYLIPPELQPHYTEKVVYLPDSYQANDTGRRIAERTPSRSEANLPETGFVFCCFNNNYKITPDIFDIWMRLLDKVEGSVLWLLEDNRAASRNLRQEAAKRGISQERLVFAPRMDLDEHLARHRLADLFLDTLPINAHTTASDALWAGLPLLTCMGEAFAAKVAASLLNAIGLPELITRHLEEYEALALELATTPALLADIRSRLAQNRTSHPLFDTNRFRRHIESAYSTMWERYQRGEPPASFAVPPLP
jgi:predicted O-linked N-acetylglucosamine transferase (SPINDLY family)